MRLQKWLSVLAIFILLLSISGSVVSSIDGEKTEDQVFSEPYEPSGPIPEDGESGVNATPELYVYVSHPEDLSMDVSFYDNASDGLIGTDENVSSGELAKAKWEGLDPESNYSWYAVADDGENTTTGGPWNFSTASVDYVRITDEPDGENLSGGDVPPNHTEWGYLSGYNDSTGYVGNFKGRWNVSGNADLLGVERDSTNGIEMGENAGDAWLNVTYDTVHTYGVQYTVLTDNITRIEITDSPGGEPISNDTVPVGTQIEGYASAYNETTGFLYTIKSNWSVHGPDPKMLKENPTEQNVIDVGLEGGDVWFNVTYENFTDDVSFEVLSPTADWINITHTPDGIPLKGGEVPVGERIWGNASAYNETAGYIGLVEADWSVEGGDASLLASTPAAENGIDTGTIPEKVWFNASYERAQDSVLYSVKDPKIDWIEVRSEPDGAGEKIKDTGLPMGETIDLYAAAYNQTMGFKQNIEVDWNIDSEDVGKIDQEQGASTNFLANDTGNCNVTASYEEFEYTVKLTVFYDDDPEITGEIPDIELGKDFGIYEFDLAEHASDPHDELSDMRWYITGYDPSVIEVLGENHTGNHNLTLLSEDNSHGSMEVTYHLVNSADNEITQKAWINITSDYISPEFRSCPDLQVHYGEPYEFDYSPYIIYDEEEKNELTLETDDPAHAEVDGLRVTYEYPESELGEEILVVLTVSDGKNSDHTAITVEVTSNEPPEEKEELPDLEIEQGELKRNVFDLDDYFYDPEGDPLYMSYGYTYLRVTIHANDSVDIEADVDWHGVETVTFRAEDPNGAIFEQTINVTVIPINYPPEIKELPELVVHYDEPYVFDLEYYISDRDNETSELSISTDPSEYISVDGTELIMVFPEDMDGQTVPLEVFVSDGKSTASRHSTVTIGDVYPPELVLPLHDVAFKENERLTNAFHLDNHFIDRQNDTMYYSSGNEHIEVDIHENSSVDFYAPENWYGEELITIRAKNSAGALMEDSLTVTVLPVNQPPVISEIPRLEGIVGESWIFDISDYISDPDNETHELDVAVDSPNIEVIGHKLILDYETPGEYEINLEVSDGLESNTTEIDVLVRSEDDGFLANNWFLISLVLLPLALIGSAYYLKQEEFTIEDVFLIHDSGVLIKHKTRTLKAERDEEILAGMFTAVNNFVGDAFGGQEKHTLKRMEYGDDKVLVHKGENVILAVFVSGEEPSWVLEGMSELVADIEERYEGDIEDWDGDIDSLPGIEGMLDKMIKNDGKYSQGDWKK